MLPPNGPSGQEASVVAFADNFCLSVHPFNARAPAIKWSEDDEGLQGILRATLVRQLNERGVSDWRTKTGSRPGDGPGSTRSCSQSGARLRHAAARGYKPSGPREMALGFGTPGSRGGK